MVEIMVERRIKRASTYYLPPSSDRCYETGYLVLILIERIVSNRIWECTGPFKV